MEQWRAVVGFEGLYEVSDLGRVRSSDRTLRIFQRLRSGESAVVAREFRGKMLKPGIASNGYPTVSLRGVTHTIHSLVARAFIGPRPRGNHIRHKDGYRRNPALTNLCYGTPAENVADTDRHGRRVRGSGYRNAKLTEAAAREIRAAKGVVSQSALAEMYGVSPAAVQAVHDGRTWTHA